MVKLQQASQALVRLGCLLILAVAFVGQTAQAGCPFDDGSCQEYCNQQGCNLGYCGHFAWIQCICRRCGDEWNWYDKVHYNPDKQVNQTELDSLKLNTSVPLILTNNNANRSSDRKQQQQPQQQPQLSPKAKAVPVPVLAQEAPLNLQTKPTSGQQVATTSATPQKVAATLTTLLIPDLSDGSKLDLNDIPDENSDKFLDYLTKNHEKLVQATHNVQLRQGGSSSAARSASASTSASQDNEDEVDSDQLDADQQMTSASADDEPQAEETVEITISSSNNNSQQTAQQQRPQQQAATNPATNMANNKSGSTSRSSSSTDVDPDGEEGKWALGKPVMRLLRMAVAERSSD